MRDRKRERRISFYAMLFAADLCGIALAFGLAGAARFYYVPSYAVPITFGTMALFIAFSKKAYTAETLLRWWVGARRASTAIVVATLAVVVATYAIKESEVSRVWMSLSLLLSLSALWLNRCALAFFARRAFRHGTQSRLLITDGLTIAADRSVHQYDATELAIHEDGIHPIALNEIAQRIAGYDVVAICATPERRRAWAHAVQGSAKPTYMLIPELDHFGALRVDRFEGVPMVVASAGALDWRDVATKRGFDLCVSGVLLLLLAPLLALVALAIRIDSPGPILFRQRRVGFGNRIFSVLKFRSMRHDLADGAGTRSAARDDDRITRIGRFIRATSIDELPQLFNVLRGEMSLVGPRPHALGSLVGEQLFWEVDARYHYRHACKPGLTGLAQVRGHRGATERREDLINRLDADLEYGNDWSLWRDIGIIVATSRVLIHRNAY